MSTVIHNVTVRCRFFFGRVESDIGATHRRLSTTESVAYIDRVFTDYLAYGGLSREALRTKTVLELGPGDNLGVALRLYAAGAQRVFCLDKFYATRDTEQQVAIYRALRNSLTAREQRRYDQAVKLDGGVTIDERCVTYRCGVPIEKADTVLSGQTFDLIVSRAVLWEIYDTDRAFEVLDRVLRPGGTQIHKIACLDWLFKDRFHPLEFLTISDALYDWMARDSGKSNRRTIAYYREVVKRLGYDAAFHITRVVGMRGEDFPPGVDALRAGVHYSGEHLRAIAAIRPRLLERFRQLSDHDLLVEDMFLVARKFDGLGESRELAQAGAEHANV